MKTMAKMRSLLVALGHEHGTFDGPRHRSLKSEWEVRCCICVAGYICLTLIYRGCGVRWVMKSLLRW